MLMETETSSCSTFVPIIFTAFLEKVWTDTIPCSVTVCLWLWQNLPAITYRLCSVLTSRLVWIPSTGGTNPTFLSLEFSLPPPAHFQDASREELDSQPPHLLLRPGFKVSCNPLVIIVGTICIFGTPLKSWPLHTECFSSLCGVPLFQ